mgnify:CR=1 FL=1
MADSRVYWPSQPLWPVGSPRQENSPSAPARGKETSFAEILGREERKVSFSQHALQRLRDRESALRAQKLAQIRAVDELHDEEPLACDHALVKHGDDAGVNDSCGRARLAAESCDEILGVCQVRVHDLECDRAIKAFILRDVDGGHAATRQPARHPVPFVDEEADQRVRLVECLFVAHLLDSMGVFAKSLEVPTSVRRMNGVLLRS